MGKIRRQIPLKKFILSPLSPFPSMTAPVYLNGKIPANPNTPPCTRELNTPMITIATIISGNEVLSSNNWAIKGRARVVMKTPMNPLTSLFVRERTLAKNTPRTINVKLGPLRASPNSNPGL